MKGMRMRTVVALGVVGLLLAGGTGLEMARAEVAKAVHYQGVKTNTPVSMTLYGYLTINKKPATAGTEIAVFDQSGVLCGVSGVDAGQKGAFLLQIYGDDNTSATVDEGLDSSEGLRFEVSVPKTVKGKGGATSTNWTVISQKSLKFSSAGLNHDPPAYPPVFTDKADYGMNISSGK